MRPVERKAFDESGNRFSEEKMSSVALNEARGFLDALHDAEFRGRKDTDGAARYRLAAKLGVKESYLFRLQYRADEMKDVAGEVYRRLRLAYEGMCERVENAADRIEREAREIEETNAAHSSNRQVVASTATPAPRAPQHEVR
jgi:hypothetical protein